MSSYSDAIAKAKADAGIDPNAGILSEGDLVVDDGAVNGQARARTFSEVISEESEQDMGGHTGLEGDNEDGEIDKREEEARKAFNYRSTRPSFKKTGKSGFEITAPVQKVDADMGLVFGWAIICKDENGEEYFDAHGDHIPEDAMLKAAADFMENSRMAKEMHDGESRGSYLFAWPMTGDIAKAMGFDTKKTGLMVCLKPDAAMLKKFKSGDLRAFSIGGHRIHDEEVE